MALRLAVEAERPRLGRGAYPPRPSAAEEEAVDTVKHRSRGTEDYEYPFRIRQAPTRPWPIARPS